MSAFTITTEENITIRFTYYLQEAPQTCTAFSALLPFTATFMHAKISGNEIWSDNQPDINCIQENAGIFTFPGEVVIGPKYPSRIKTANCMGIYYGEGKGVDACNIFAKVFEEDMHLLQQLGDTIWKQGKQELKFNPYSLQSQ